MARRTSDIIVSPEQLEQITSNVFNTELLSNDHTPVTPPQSSVKLEVQELNNAISSLKRRFMQVCNISKMEKLSGSAVLNQLALKLKKVEKKIKIIVVGPTGCGKSSTIDTIFLGDSGILPDNTEGAMATTQFVISLGRAESFSVQPVYIKLAEWTKFRMIVANYALNYWNENASKKALDEAQRNLNSLKSWYPELGRLDEPQLKSTVRKMGNGQFVERSDILKLLTKKKKTPCETAAHVTSKLKEFSEDLQTRHLIERIKVRGPFTTIPWGVTIEDVPGTIDSSIIRQRAANEAWKGTDFTFILAAWNSNPFSTDLGGTLSQLSENEIGENAVSLVITHCDSLPRRMDHEERQEWITTPFKKFVADQQWESTPPLLFFTFRTGTHEMYRRTQLRLVNFVNDIARRQHEGVAQIRQSLQKIQSSIQSALTLLLKGYPLTEDWMKLTKEFENNTVETRRRASTFPKMPEWPILDSLVIAAAFADKVDRLGRTSLGYAPFARDLKNALNWKGTLEGVLADTILDACTDFVRRLRNLFERNCTEFMNLICNDIRRLAATRRMNSRALEWTIREEANLKVPRLRRKLRSLLITFFTPLFRPSYKTISELGGEGFTRGAAAIFRKDVADILAKHDLKLLAKNFFRNRKEKTASMMLEIIDAAEVKVLLELTNEDEATLQPVEESTQSDINRLIEAVEQINI